MIEKGKQKILAIFMEQNYNYFYIGYSNKTDEIISKNISIDNSNIKRKNYFIGGNHFLSFFEETEEFIFSFYDSIDIYNGEDIYCFYYSFDKDFNIVFSGIIYNYFILGDICTNNKPFSFQNLYYYHNSLSAFYSPITQRYFLIGQDYNNEFLLLLYLNKNNTIAKPSINNLNSTYFVCENYTKYINNYCDFSTENFNAFIQTNLTLIKKCTNEIQFIQTSFPSVNYTILEVFPMIPSTLNIPSTLIIEST